QLDVIGKRRGRKRKGERHLHRSELTTKVRDTFSARALRVGREAASRLSVPPAPRFLRSRGPRGPHRGPQLFHQLPLLVRGQFRGQARQQLPPSRRGQLRSE